MFEEVPRTRRGLSAYLGVSRLTARRIVLGPFVIGGGVVLAAVGGSVAVAATVFTASTIRASDIPPHPRPEPAVVTASASASKAKPHHSGTPAPAASAVSSASAVSASNRPSPSSSASSSHPSSTAQRTTPASSLVAGSPTAPATSTSPTKASPSSSPSATPSPAGNAVVYVSGWNADRKQLLFEFAAISKGTGPQHSDVYSIASPKQYTATLASGIQIISGGQLCPPAGSYCTPDQLIAGTAHGFYAELAVDPMSAVHQVIERDNVAQNPPPTAPTPTPTASTGFGPAPTATPTAGTTP